ncbi:hypothetical protein ACFWN7_13365 [Agromyces sp. NPDC058484]|uniref:COG1470 family protein n=1 Tax=Agromyces sp. NPDC058484 TaxID=3346524 RepID=UPI00365AA8DB
MSTNKSFPRAMILAAAALALGGALIPSTAFADEEETKITWAVSPAGADGPDGRAWMELELDPGATASEHLAVRNLSDVAAVFDLIAADGYFTKTGRFNMLPSSEPSVDGGTWIAVQDAVEVAPGATAVVPFTITVPDNATPGDHPAGIAASVSSVSTGPAGSNVGVESRVGFRVITRVTGELDPSLAVPASSVEYVPSWNPFSPGTLRVDYELENDGNVQIGAHQRVRSSGAFGRPPMPAEELGEFFPGDRRTFTAEVRGVWPIGLVNTEILVQPERIDDQSGSDAALEPVRVDVSTWAIPVPQLVLVVAAVLLFLWFRLERRRHRRKLDAMLAAARAEGERAAGGTPPTTTDQG